MIEFLKAILFGIVEGITEWLPISSTGHLILLDNFMTLNVTRDVWDLFEVVIQFGAILATVVIFWDRIWPFNFRKTAEERKNIWTLWFKIVVAIMPTVVAGLLIDDWVNANFYNYVTVAAMLIIYGVAFILIERRHAGKKPRVETTDDISYRDALLIGLFQVLAIVPGTSRSGATILGAIIIGLSRPAAAEFTFFLAIPTMLGASVLKSAKFVLGGGVLSIGDAALIAAASIVAFAVSFAVIRFLMSFVKRHTFSSFGVYRIVLGVVVLAYFLLNK